MALVTRSGLLLDTHMELLFATLPVLNETDDFLLRDEIDLAIAQLLPSQQNIPQSLSSAPTVFQPGPVSSKPTLGSETKKSAPKLSSRSNYYFDEAKSEAGRQGPVDVDAVDAWAADARFDAVLKEQLADCVRDAAARAQGVLALQQLQKESDRARRPPHAYGYFLRLREQRHITAQGFAKLGKLVSSHATSTQILDVDLSLCLYLSDDAACRSQALTDSDNPTPPRLFSVARACPQLLKLNLSGCPLLTNAAISAVSLACPHLMNLQFELASRIDDSAVQDAVHHLQSLTCLNLGGCANITNVGFQIISAHSARLRTLCVAGCRGLTDYG